MSHIFRRLSLWALPKRTLTSVVGGFARTSLSKYAIPWYVRHYKINCTEAEYPMDEYRSLVDFFSRRLRAESRSISEDGIVCPVDGTVSENGLIKGGLLLQAKGSTYSITSLLGDEAMAESYLGGHYITLYLSPSDYHRIHTPLSGVIRKWRHVPGTLYPVNASGVRFIPGLFTKNERLVTEIQTPYGLYAVVKVGATIVGSIRTDYGPEYRGPFSRKRADVVTQRAEVPVERGEELGRFEFGSTVILLFAPGLVGSIDVSVGDVVRMGQRIGTLEVEKA